MTVGHVDLVGSTTEDVIKAQDAHLKAAVGAGDTVHQGARNDMRDRLGGECG